jgi:hypothetical protein
MTHHSHATTLPPRAQEFPVSGLMRYIWQKRLMVVAIALLCGLLWACWGVLSVSYTASTMFQQRSVTTQGITISPGNSDLRFINSPNFARMVASRTSWPLRIDLSDRTATAYIVHKLTNLGAQQPTLRLQHIAWNGDTIPPLLEVRYLGDMQYELRAPGVMEPKKLRFSQRYSDGVFSIQIDHIAAPPNAVFELKTLSSEQWQRHIATVTAESSGGGSNAFVRLSSGASVIDMRAHAHNASQALWIVEQSKNAYLQFAAERGRAPLEESKKSLEKHLERNLAALEEAQSEAKELLSEYGVANFAESAQFIHDQMRRINADLVTARNEFITISEELTENHPAVSALRNRLRYLERERVKLTNELSLLPEKEFTYQQLAQKAELLKKHISANIDTLANLDVQATASAGTLTALGAAFLIPNDLFAIVLRRTSLGFFVVLLAMSGYLTIRFTSHYLRHGFYVASARNRQLPVIADVAMPSMRARYNSVNSVLNALGAAQKAFHPISNAMRYLMDVASDRQIFITYHADAKNAALTTLSTAIYLARHSGKKVCLVDADFANAHCTQMLKQNTDKGLVSLLLHKSKTSEVIRSILPDRLDFIPASQMPVNSGMLMQGDAFKTLLDDLRTEYDYVLVHMPPMNSWMHWYDAQSIQALIMQIVPLGVQPMQWYELIEQLPASVHHSLYLMLCRFKRSMLPASEI